MKTERMIPNIYEQSFDMRLVCRLFDAEMEILEYYTNHILDCYSPEHCPKDLLDQLAEHIGFDYQELKSVMYNRVVLKNFIKNLIRYRGSSTGIGNAAAIDIRYRQTYPDRYFNAQSGEWEDDPEAGEQIPMSFHESIDINKTWIDVDDKKAIIYLFIIASDYFPAITAGMSDEEKKANFEERMRRLLDLAYLQEYVRPVGMYLLPMVARKVNPETDMTVKAVRIPDYERNRDNGVEGTPNSSMQHQYDRMLFAKLENPDDEISVEPWIRTLYHSQLAGTLNHQYFTKPVYHIEGKFLYYDHDELLDIYKRIMDSPRGTLGMKIGDSLYNPNIASSGVDYSYGPDPSDEAQPESIQEAGKALITDTPLNYQDNVGFPLDRTYQAEDTIALPPLTSPDEEYPIYQDEQVYTTPATGYLVDAYTGTHQPTIETPGDADDWKEKNLMINLFQVDLETGESKWTGMSDVQIAGKGDVTRKLADIVENDKPVGDDIYWTIKDADGEPPENLIP